MGFVLTLGDTHQACWWLVPQFSLVLWDPWGHCHVPGSFPGFGGAVDDALSTAVSPTCASTAGTCSAAQRNILVSRACQFSGLLQFDLGKNILFYYT